MLNFRIRGRVVEGAGLIIRFLKKTPLVQTQPDALNENENENEKSIVRQDNEA